MLASQTQALTCPIEGDQTSAVTQEGHAVRYIEHYYVNHINQDPVEIPAAVDSVIKAVLEDLKGKYR